jgi:hypothetical protein
MENRRAKRIDDGSDPQLTTLMRAMVEARFRLERARERLRDNEQKLRSRDQDAYERQREKALGDYIEAMGKARVARTQLLKRLRNHAA